MKKIIISLLFIVISMKGFSQQNPVDSMKILRDSIYNYKVNYTGQPLYKLMNDLKVNIEFGDPDNRGNRTQGTAYYQNFKMYIDKPGFPVCGFKIKLANKVDVDLGEVYIIGRKAWNAKVRYLLGSEILVDFEKY